ncbi:ras and Rab interactor 3 [Leuresthes tenuis]|uniref:ras and Rab interactor 3 n=1 Tax=Leuresthes tenuis TaxID=355514 RepID=UPI003B510BCF
MMEASVVSQDTGLSCPPSGALTPSSLTSSAPLPPSLPSQPPARPCRPRPPPPTLKPSQNPSRPPLPPSIPLSPHPSPAPPPSLSFNPPPPSLPPPLSPIVVSQSPPPSTTSSDLVPSFSPPPSLPPPLSPKVSPLPSSSPPPPPPPAVAPSSPAPPMLSALEKLVGSISVWQPKGLSQDQIGGILEKETAGMFLVHSSGEKASMVSLRLADEGEAPLVRHLTVKQHKTFVHLEGSSLVFDDIFKLITFYCASRDILTVQLKLPQAVTMATKREELEVISALGAEFWMSDLNQRPKNQDDTIKASMYLYVNPVTVEDQPNKDQNPPSTSQLDTITNDNATSSLQNGEASQRINPQVKAPFYKRPPPRPPGRGSSSSSSSSSPPSPKTLAQEPERKEEGSGVTREKEDRKSVSTSPPPSRPPVPLQGRAAPPLPPAPLRRTSSKKNADRDTGEGTGREKGQKPAEKAEREGGGEKGQKRTENRAGLLFMGAAEQEAGSPHKEEEVHRKEGETRGEEDEKEDKSGPSSVKKPSRPVPPPRAKPCCTEPPGGGAGMKIPPPSPARRPDVSLYSPQGGAALGADLDSCSTSSTEEEGDVNQEQEQNHKSLAESRSPKAVIRRTPTTMMLNRARSRLSTVLTGLISHDRRLSKRIVELARDPQSYFGNLVKEHRAFTLETMSNHSTSTELLQEIRQMMTQLKSYLLQSTELQAMLEPQHQYTQDKLENIVEAALCKSVLKPLREPIYQSLEKLHTGAGSVKQLGQNQSVVLSSTTTALGITTSVPEASAMEKISIKLNNLHQEYSPQKKIELLLKTCKIIYDSMSVSCPGRAHGADDFLPVMMYVLARCNLSALQLDVEYMMELMDPSLTLGEGSYYLTTTYGALEHIKTFDQQRSATRQLSREVQDSIHRWERRRTLNQERTAQGSVRDFLTVYCPEMGANPKTLGVFPTMTIQQLTEQCAARFEQDSYMLSLYMDDVQQPVTPTDLALRVKNSCPPGGYCFVYHPVGQQPGNQQPGNQQPGNQQPGNQQPGNQQPGNQQPGNQQPGNQQPGRTCPSAPRPAPPPAPPPARAPAVTQAVPPPLPPGQPAVPPQAPPPILPPGHPAAPPPILPPGHPAAPPQAPPPTPTPGHPAAPPPAPPPRQPADPTLAPPPTLPQAPPPTPPPGHPADPTLAPPPVLPPAPPAGSLHTADTAAVSSPEPEVEEESLINF